jgi:hypothetical protein
MKKMIQIENKYTKDKRTKKKLFKKSFYAPNKTTPHHDEDEVSESETEIVIFMAVEESNKEGHQRRRSLEIWKQRLSH